MDQTPETQETEAVVDTDAAKSRAKAFLRRHSSKLKVVATVVAGTAVFAAGRKSKDYVEDVDVNVKTPEDSQSDQS